VDLAALHAELEHQARLATLGTIAGLIAHEFNNLLTPVISYAQMALADPADLTLTAKALERTLAGAEQAAQIASALLELARPDTATPPPTGSGAPGPSAHLGGPIASSTDSAAVRSGREWSGRTADSRGTESPVPAAQEGATVVAPPTTPPRSTWNTPVRDALARTLASLARDPARDGIRLETSVDESLAVAIRPVALQHVLLNLVLNARKAMLPGGGRLSITARPLHGPEPTPDPDELDSRTCSTWNAHLGPAIVTPTTDRWVEIAIQDSGRGMSPERQARLFRPLPLAAAASLRAEPEPSPPGDPHGTGSLDAPRSNGLGLIVCKRLIEGAGGWLLIRSAPGVGTRIRVILPAA
jgi:signal transduction histidine kinase